MSMPFLDFSCSRCSFTASDVVTWASFSYESSAGLVSLNSNIGWCDNCSTLEPVEILPSIQKIDKMKSEYTDKKHRISRYLERIEPKRSWIKKLLKIHIELPSKFQELQNQCQDLLRDIEEEQQRITLLTSRKSGPRCLSCGSTSCFPLPPFTPLGTYDNPGKAIKIGVKHPHCGGDLLVEHSPMRLIVSMNQCIYDTEGNLIQTYEIDKGY
jgi:hypothetical protein